MPRTRIKICGIRKQAHALHALRCGADALGFVFYEPSPRYVTPAAVAEIVAALPAFCSAVGLFVNVNTDVVAATVAATGLNLVQFHGDETAAECDAAGLPYIKAVRVKSRDCIVRASDNYPDAQALLLDAFLAGIPGGTGQQFDWSLVPDDLQSKVIIAGGLTPANVGELVQHCRPWAVDVSGGVERRKGVQDNNLIAAFIKAVQMADRELGNNE